MSEEDAQSCVFTNRGDGVVWMGHPKHSGRGGGDVRQRVIINGMPVVVERGWRASPLAVAPRPGRSIASTCNKVASSTRGRVYFVTCRHLSLHTAPLSLLDRGQVVTNN